MAQADKKPKKKDDWFDKFETVKDDKFFDKFETVSDDEPVPEEEPIVESDEPGILSRAWSAVSEPLTDLPSQIARSLSGKMAESRQDSDNPFTSSIKGFYEGATEGVGDVLSQLTSPIDLAATALGLGSATKAMRAIPKITRALNIGVNAPVVAHGGQTLLDPDSTWGERAFGIAEIGGGLAGMGNNLGKIRPSIPEAIPEVKPTILDILSKTDEPPIQPPIQALLPNEISPNIINEGTDIIDANTGEVMDMAMPEADINPVESTFDTGEPDYAPDIDMGGIPPVEPSIIPEFSPTFVPSLTKPLPKMRINTDGTFSPVDNPSIKLDGAGKPIQTPLTGLDESKPFIGPGGFGGPRGRHSFNELDMPESFTQGNLPLDSGQKPPNPPWPPSKGKGPEFGKIPTPKTAEEWSVWNEVLNIPRAIQASIDLPPFRQGLPMITNKAWWTSWDDMMKSYGSQTAYDVVDQTIKSEPLYDVAIKSGVKFTDLLSQTEESYSSKLAGYLPGVRRSHRAHTAFLNKMRMDSFKSLHDDVMRSSNQPGVTESNLFGFDTNEVLAKQVANFVNDATGRGSLGSLEKNAELLNNALFSPRLISSRVRMYNRYFNPISIMNQPPAIRKETLKSLFGVAGSWIAIAGLSQQAGAEVSLNPTNSDFGKIRIGNFRMDPAGGFQQYAVAVSRLISGHSTKTNTTFDTEKTQEFGEGMFSSSYGGVVGNFALNKLNPPWRFAYDLFNASKNRPFSLGDEAIKMAMPIIVQDLIELSKEDPRLLPFLIPAALGMGSNIYGERGEDNFLPKQFDIQSEGGSMWK